MHLVFPLSKNPWGLERALSPRDEVYHSIQRKRIYKIVPWSDDNDRSDKSNMLNRRKRGKQLLIDSKLRFENLLSNESRSVWQCNAKGTTCTLNEGCRVVHYLRLVLILVYGHKHNQALTCICCTNCAELRVHGHTRPRLEKLSTIQAFYGPVRMSLIEV